jgi:hypothetical protein
MTRNVVGVTGSTDGIPTIGSVGLFTMPDDLVPATKTIRAWANAGLDPADLPDVRSGADVFASECRKQETRRRNGVEVEIKVDVVADDPAEIVYQFTRMVRDKAQRVIEHPKALTLAFDKSAEQITVRQLEDYDKLRGIEEAVRDGYAKHAQDLSGQKIRNSIRDLLLRMGATNLRRKAGGVYFIPNEHLVDGKPQPTAPVLDGIARFLEDLYGGDADFYRIPLAAEDAFKDMVAKHFALNVGEQMEATLLKALNRVRAGKGRGVRRDLMSNLYNERRRLAGLVQQYDELVGLDRKKLDADMRDLDKALEDLEDLQDGDEA